MYPGGNSSLVQSFILLFNLLILHRNLQFEYVLITSQWKDQLIQCYGFPPSVHKKDDVPLVIFY